MSVQPNITPLKQKDIEKAKLATLNNILCLMNEEVKKVKAVNEVENEEAFKINTVKRNAFENIQMLSNSFNTLEGK